MGIELFACSATQMWNVSCILGAVVGDSQVLVCMHAWLFDFGAFLRYDHGHGAVLV
jgi:hypothetical protein